MKVLCGRFHPELEDALFDALRARAPLAPVAVVVPSRWLVERLQLRAAREFPRGLAAVDFRTLFAFAARDVETNDDPLFMEYLIGEGNLSRALRSTLQDLREAAIEPDLLDDALEEAEVPVRYDLAGIYRRYVGALQRTGVVDRVEVFKTAAPNPTLSHVYFYGFYDLTQVQWDFVERVARALPTTILAPIPMEAPGKPRAGYRYAETFLNSYLYGLAGRLSGAVEVLPGPDEPLFADDDRRIEGAFRFRRAAGARDQLWDVAREIQRLVVDEKRARYDEIGVVARSMEPYAELVRDVFDEHGVPYRTATGRPASTHPFVKTAALLVNLRDFDRRPVMELLGSPHFKADKNPAWDDEIRRKHISHGLDAWKRFSNFALIRELADSLAKVPERATWTAFVDAYRALFDRWLEPCDIELPLEAFRAFDRAGKPTTRKDFLEYFTRRLESLELPPPPRNRGVTVLDAMAARGLSFRFLFAIGLNDQEFPRVVLADPFLSDASRRAISDTLGHKMPRRFRVPEKAAGYDEERLLFSILLNAAGEETTLVCQRADDRGRMAAPSVLWDLLRDRLGAPANPYDVPRSILAKMTDLSRLTPLEAAAFVPPPAKRPPDDWKGELTPFDGAVGRVDVRALSPTAIETYAQCPFKYFASRLLKLQELEEPAEVESLSPLEEGTLYDDILTKLYGGLKKFNDVPAAIVALRKVAREVFDEFEKTSYALPPALWEVTRERLLADLEAYVAYDLTHLDDYVPAEFQQDLASEVFRGRADRIDRHKTLGTRVVDYKRRFNSGKHGGAFATKVLQLHCVQPGIYAELADARSVEFHFIKSYALYEPIAAKPVEHLFRQTLALTKEFKTDFRRRVGGVIDLIRAGSFPIVPKDGPFGYCGHCPYSNACRKNHRPTRFRSANAESAADLEDLRS